MSVSPPAPLRGVPAAARVAWDGGDATVVVQGEIDYASAPVLWARLAEAVAGAPRSVVVDLAGVTFMDCSGIRLLVRAGRLLPPGSHLVLRSPTRRVRRLLRLTGMDLLFMVQDLPRGTVGVTPGSDALAG